MVEGRKVVMSGENGDEVSGCDESSGGKMVQRGGMSIDGDNVMEYQ